MVIGLLTDLSKIYNNKTSILYSKNNISNIYIFDIYYFPMKHYTYTYTLLIYIFHVIFVAIPLLYYGFRGQHKGTIDSFGYVVLSLLGGMALVFHGYWIIDRIIQKYREKKPKNKTLTK